MKKFYEKYIKYMLASNLRRMMWSLIFTAASASMIYNGGVIGELVRSEPKGYDFFEILTLILLACFVASVSYWVIDGVVEIRKRKNNAKKSN